MPAAGLPFAGSLSFLKYNSCVDPAGSTKKRRSHLSSMPDLAPSLPPDFFSSQPFIATTSNAVLAAPSIFALVGRLESDADANGEPLADELLLNVERMDAVMSVRPLSSMAPSSTSVLTVHTACSAPIHASYSGAVPARSLSSRAADLMVKRN
eukprot:2647043-Prymnesium_polylepis.1